MKIRNLLTEGPTEVTVRQIPIGTVFLGKVGGRSTFLRTFDGIVDLENPHRTWTRADNMEIESYHPVEVELIIRKYLKAG